MTQRTLTRLAATAAALAAMALPAQAQQQGVSKDEILVGSILDLSGPLAGYGKDVRNGMLMRIADINEQGGIHGRKLTLRVEDNGYDPKRAVLAAQKLVNQDKVFIMSSILGAGSANAAMPVLRQKGIINFFPMALAKDMYEPLDKHIFAIFSSYIEQMTLATPLLYKERKATKACALYQDDDYGQDVMKGGEAGLKQIGVEYAERTSYKRGATDFSSQVARLRAANCDFVVLGTVIRETVGAVAEARKLDYHPTFLTSMGAYTDLIPRLGGKGMDGIYSVMTAVVPYEDGASPQVRAWATKYRTAFNESPTLFSAYGYAIMDRLGQALRSTGPNLTTDAMVKSLEAFKSPTDMFGLPAMSMSPSNHLATRDARISQIQNGRWAVVIDYDQMKK